MTTSNSTNFEIDAAEYIEEAFELFICSYGGRPEPSPATPESSPGPSEPFSSLPPAHNKEPKGF